MSRLFPIACLAFVSLFCRASTLTAGIIYDENNDGSLSTNSASPTLLLGGNPLPLGLSSLRGVVERATGIGDVDVFSFNIQAGTQLTEIRIPEYISDDQIAVMGMNNANFFPFNPSTFTNTLTLIDLQQIIGVAQFGEGWDNTTGFNARDLLHGANAQLTPANLIGSRSSGFKAFENYGPNDQFNAVGAGIYTIYVQQTGANTEYQMDFTVVQVPEPSSLMLVGLVAAATCAARRRRR